MTQPPSDNGPTGNQYGRLVTNNSVISVGHGDETVLLQPMSGRYFTLNETGTEVWVRLQDGCALADIVDAMRAKYGLARENIERDVRLLVAALCDAELVTATPVTS
jgi:hypothetical protein